MIEDNGLPQIEPGMALIAPKMDQAHDRLFVTALARGIAVLRCFSASEPILGASEIARKTDLPQPTVWRLCHTLSKLGLLVPAPASDKFQVGLAALGLGISALPSTDIGQLAVAEMRQLANQYRAAVSLCVPDQTGMLITERAQGSGSLVLNLNVGSRFDMGISAPGAAYSACLSEGARAALFETLEKHYGDRWPPIREKFVRATEQYRIQGFVASRNELRPGISSVAVPIVLEQDSHVFVVTCGAPSETLDEDLIRNQLGPAVKVLAAGIKEVMQTSGKHHFVGTLQTASPSDTKTGG